MSTFIITTRNPRNNGLVIIQGEDENVLEFSDQDKATEEADFVPVCRAWGFEIVEVP